MDADAASAARGPSRPKISFGGLKKGSERANVADEASGKRVNAFSFDEEDEKVAADNKTTEGKKKVIGNGLPYKGIAGAAPSSRSSRQRQDEALAVDPSVFDYDGVFDSMKAGAERIKAQRKEEEQKRDPKYMQASFAASEQRKLDRTRAEARKIQRQREEEGDSFADTESFVTGAYKRQMDEMREDEERERERDKAERQRSKGVAGFYKDFLAEQDRTHNAAVEAAAHSASSGHTLGKANVPEEECQQSDEQRKRQRIEEAQRKGLNVRTNDDNEVVDERSLLSAGLNTFGSKRKGDDTGRDTDEQRRTREAERFARPAYGGNDRWARDAQRIRQSKMIEEQMLAVQRQKEEEQKALQRAQKEALTSVHRRNDAHRIEQARQRALERRKQRSEEQSNVDKSTE